MLPKLHPLEKTFIELRRAQERISLYRLGKPHDTALDSIQKQVRDLIDSINTYQKEE